MKRYSVAAFGLALALCAVAVVLSIDVAHATPLTMDAGSTSDLLVYANAALAVMRSDHAALVKRAADKIAEVKDGLAPEQVRAIESEHAELVRQADALKGKISEAEAAERNAPPPADAIAVERTRTAEIARLAQRHGMPETFASEHIAAGTALDQVRTLVLDAVAARSAGQRISPRVQVIADEGDTVRNAVEAAIMLRANPQAIRPDNAANIALIEQARNWRGMSLLEAGRAFLEEVSGQRMRGYSRMELAGAVLGLQTRAGMHTTSDFANILANVAAKRLRSAYQTAPSGWKKLSRQSNNPDFKEKAVTQLSNLPQFKQVREGQEFEFAALADGQEKYGLLTYGRIVPITRQVLINDDLGAFDRIPMLLGRAAAEKEASIFWSIFTGNPTMNDGVALFHATHGNLGTPGAIDESGLSEGRKKMREQKGLAVKAADAEPLNLTPKILVASPAKETEAQKMLSAVLAAQTSNVNIFASSLELMIEARLTGNAWYLVADPAMIDTIEYAYLEGEEGLYTESRTGFEVDGIEVKGRIDFAAKAIDHRGMFKNAGN